MKKKMDLFRGTVLALFCIVALTSCGSEQTSQVFSGGETGLVRQATWSNEKWKLKLPEGWIVEPVFGMRDASFRVIGTNGEEAEVAFSQLPLQGGTLAGNVNRWRVQAGLEPWEDTTVVSQLKKIDISGYPAYRMEFSGASESGSSIYGIIMEEKEQRIFIKFSGPVSLMEQQQEAWDYFVNNMEIQDAR